MERLPTTLLVDPNDPNDLAAFVRRVRSSTGLSQHAFAEKYGLNTRTLQGWEQGSRFPDKTALVLLALIHRNAQFVANMISRLRHEGNPYVSVHGHEHPLTPKIDL